MFHNLQIRSAKSHRRKPSLTIRSGVTKRRVSAVSAATASNVPSITFMENLFGAEFPEAFDSTDERSFKSKKTILDLPTELLDIVCEYVSKLDIKRLRLASKRLADSVYLRIDRVYISPNRANLDYLRTILAHPRYKGRVHEIVFDGTRLEEYPTLESFRKAIIFGERHIRLAICKRLDEALEIYGDDGIQYYHFLNGEGMFKDTDGYLNDAVKEILLRYEDDFSRDVLARNAMMMSIADSYAVYQDLYREEQEIASQQLDAEALHQALAGFPKLKRITLTSETWWPWNIQPRYNTPFRRSLPSGFRKPVAYSGYDDPVPLGVTHLNQLPEPDRSVCRGYSIVLSALLSMPVPSIEELIFDSSNNSRVGMPWHIFDSNKSAFLDSTKLMFRRTPLNRLQLSFVYCACTSTTHQGSNIKAIIPILLSELRNLEHLDLNMRGWDWYDDQSVTYLLHEQRITTLKTLTLRHCVMSEDELYNLIIALKSVQHVTLCHMTIDGSEPVHWVQTFERLRDYYATTMQISKPHYTIIEPLPSEGGDVGDDGEWLAEHYSHLVDEEVDAFLYREADCPFLETAEREDEWDVIRRDVGWRVYDGDWASRESMSQIYEREGRYEM
ncbi:Cyclin-like F-box [Pyrenophora seminiperda CCB06]|uniref:Cyclin-like F-box n=1 Tax=Pyrenophora seminiperda CCB06 TaxID=1302712 RepID=A0A3M7MDW5_9PLEO|nr:Cyclin-like F-box [Pyrenophora seminiperda CCB06]